MFKRKRIKKPNRGEEEKKNRRNQKGYREDLSPPTDGTTVFEEECSELLRELLKLYSQESSLTFELYHAFEEAKIETLRLSGLIASCRLENEELAENLYKELEIMFDKYVKGSE